MRHYELCILVHPDQSEQVPAMIERLKTLVANRTARSNASKTGAVVSSPTRSKSSSRLTMFS